MRAKVWLVAILVVLLVAGLVLPAAANDLPRILGGIALGWLMSESYKLSDKEIAGLGTEAVRELEAEHQVYVDPRVSRIGAELVLQEKLYGTRIKVIEEPEKNAFAVPTQPGTVYITSGYLAAGLTDDQLSFVLGHEIGHLAKKHAHSNLRRAGERRGVIVGLLVATGANETWQDIGSGLDFFMGNRYSQKQELEADTFGYQATAAIGRNPLAALEAFDKLRDGREPPRWLNDLFGTHPLLSDRKHRLALQGKTPLAATAAQPADSRSGPRVQGPTVVVVVDPEASYSTSYGFGRGYYYSEDISRVTKQETEVALEKQGFQVLVSTRDVGPIQDELELENSEWGERGEGRTPIGEFAGAERIYYVSAYPLQEQGYRAGDWRNQAEARGLTVGVILREVEVRTRRQLVTHRGKGTARGLSEVRINVGGGWDPVRVQVEQTDNLARRAVGAAVSKALPALAPVSPAQMAARPVNVEREQEFTLYIRPENAKPGDPRVVVAHFPATLQEVVLNNRIHFFRGKTVIATVQVNLQESQPEKGILEGWLWAPAWKDLDLAGAETVKLTSR